MPQPVIAAINGFALGGGCELSMACDIRIASEKAKFGQPEVSLGIIPGFGGTQRLARLVGKGIAKELIYTGDMIDAQEAWRIGLVNKVTTAEELLPTARAMAQKIMSRGNFAVQMAKSAIHNGLNTDLATGSNYEAALFGVTCATEDKKEGMTAFVEKRKPAFPGK
jgi:enoyl-CoA hydratase